MGANMDRYSIAYLKKQNGHIDIQLLDGDKRDEVYFGDLQAIPDKYNDNHVLMLGAIVNSSISNRRIGAPSMWIVDKN